MRVLRSVFAASVAATLASSPAVSAEPSFVPVYQVNFPDPDVLLADGEFIAYATNDGINLPMAKSKDLVSWSAVMDPARPGTRLDGMPVLAPWVKAGATWAPEVHQVGANYLLYYTANNRKLDRQCVGLATATQPQESATRRKQGEQRCARCDRAEAGAGGRVVEGCVRTWRNPRRRGWYRRGYGRGQR